jgi:hypothetical protein
LELNSITGIGKKCILSNMCRALSEMYRAFSKLYRFSYSAYMEAVASLRLYQLHYSDSNSITENRRKISFLNICRISGIHGAPLEVFIAVTEKVGQIDF